MFKRIIGSSNQFFNLKTADKAKKIIFFNDLYRFVITDSNVCWEKLGNKKLSLLFYPYCLLG